MTQPTRLTAEQREAWIRRARAIPQTVERLLNTVAGMNEGQTYTVESFKNHRRSTVTGSFAGRQGEELTFTDGAGRKRRVLIPNITRITTAKENR
jgi:hypothetical protein